MITGDFYQVTVVVEHDNGEKTKKVKELYLVNAVSVTDAETKIHEIFKNEIVDFEVASVTKTRILKVIE